MWLRMREDRYELIVVSTCVAYGVATEEHSEW